MKANVGQSRQGERKISKLNKIIDFGTPKLEHKFEDTVSVRTKEIYTANQIYSAFFDLNDVDSTDIPNLLLENLVHSF